MAAAVVEMEPEPEFFTSGDGDGEETGGGLMTGVASSFFFEIDEGSINTHTHTLDDQHRYSIQKKSSVKQNYPSVWKLSAKP